MTYTEQGKAGMQARREAEAELFVRHADELRELIDAAYAKRGLTYKPKLTREERAKKQAEEKRAKAVAREMEKRRKAVAQIRETAVKNGLPDPYTDEEAEALAVRQLTEDISAEAEDLEEKLEGTGVIVADGAPDSPEFQAARQALEDGEALTQMSHHAAEAQTGGALPDAPRETAEEFEQRLRRGETHPLE